MIQHTVNSLYWNWNSLEYLSCLHCLILFHLVSPLAFIISQRYLVDYINRFWFCLHYWLLFCLISYPFPLILSHFLSFLASSFPFFIVLPLSFIFFFAASIHFHYMNFIYFLSLHFSLLTLDGPYTAQAILHNPQSDPETLDQDFMTSPPCRLHSTG